MRFRTEQHLRRQSEIRRVREEGRRIECRAFTLWWHRREPAAPPAADITPTPAGKLAVPAPRGARVCVIASTAAVGAAVQRARAKRRLREVFRQHQSAVPIDCDLLLIARRGVLNCPFPELEKKFTEACIHLVAKPASESASS